MQQGDESEDEGQQQQQLQQQAHQLTTSPAGGGVPGGGALCFNCGVQGHTSMECPHPRRQRPQQQQPPRTGTGANREPLGPPVQRRRADRFGEQLDEEEEIPAEEQRQASGPLRCLLGPARSLLIHHCAGARDLLNRPGKDSSWARQANTKLDQLRRTADRVEGYNNDWQAIIRSLNGEQLDAEREKYGRMAGGVPGRDGFIEILNQARQLEPELAQALDRWTDEQPAPPLQHSSPTALSYRPPRGAGGGDVYTPPPLERGPEPHYRRIKLPTLELGKFSGRREDWWSFWTKFIAAIDQNEELYPYQKLQYLMKALEGGSAEKMLAGLHITNENYEVAKELLVAEYGDERELVRDLHHRLSTVQPVKNPRQLSEFVWTVESLCAQLKALKAPTDHDYRLVDEIERKLNRSALAHVLKAKDAYLEETRGVWGMRQLRKTLREVVQREDLIRRCVGDREPAPEIKKPSRPVHRPTTTTRAFTVQPDLETDSGGEADAEPEGEPESVNCVQTATPAIPQAVSRAQGPSQAPFNTQVRLLQCRPLGKPVHSLLHSSPETTPTQRFE